MVIMIICLTWFPSRRFRRTLHIPKYGGFYKNEGILLGGSFTKLDYCPTCVVEKVWE